ncbi:PHO88-related membrane protein [Laccaria bicolor S238N-H82]|uniref:PHO88-related membrane protein n=1 Tax=Laccaria bicolor (strain S238N-H82 / ATCC MYA-4686) TaxID=486041 RepID=B0DNG3_LACBS|nr:PHO88-related membrane protein [Laccaria bicolor S238N-H82]EDR03864.1 PHO88-related membrane protein [Laccaria bicolor S238N-H82]|eukprot:XP_001885432.1 PHO88-related membrane protein [Laccaria bicolor S238N-H82]
MPIAGMHLYSKFTQPLFIQALMGIKSLYDTKPVSIHLLGNPAMGELIPFPPDPLSLRCLATPLPSNRGDALRTVGRVAACKADARAAWTRTERRLARRLHPTDGAEDYPA